MTSNKLCIWCSNTNNFPVHINHNYSFPIHVKKTMIIFEKHSLQINFCTHCQLLTMDKHPSKKLLNKIYSDFYSSYPSSDSEENIIKRNMRFMSFLIEQHIPFKGSALEIGSYNGHFLHLLKKKGIDVIGCDPNRYAAIYAKNEYDINTNIDFFSSKMFEPESFDIIVGRLVLEHITNPQEFMSEIYNLIRPGGFAIFEVPNCEKGIKNGLWFWMIEHITFFTSISLQTACKMFGLNPVHVSTDGGLLRIIAQRPFSNNSYKKPSMEFQNEESTNAISFSKNLQAYISIFNDLIKESRKKQLKLSVYGVGYFFGNLMCHTKIKFNDIVALYDSNKSKKNIILKNRKISIQDISEISTRDTNVVIIASEAYSEMLKNLNSFFRNGGFAIIFDPVPRITKDVLGR